MISEPVNKSSIRLPIVVPLIPIDGFYSGAGASSISARHSHPHQMAPEGTPGAETALHLLSDPGRQRARRERFDGPDFRGRRSDGAVRIERFLLIPTGRRP